MNATLKTKKMTDGTYAWKVVTADYRGEWTKTEARSPWGARVQGAPYLRAELEAAEIGKRFEARLKAGPRFTEDFAPKA